MGWHLARRVLGSVGKASLAFWLFFMGSGFGFVYFLSQPGKIQFHLHRLLYHAHQLHPGKHPVGQPGCGSADSPAGHPVRLVHPVRCAVPAVAVLHGRSGPPLLPMALLVLPLPPDADPLRTGTGGLLPDLRRVHAGLSAAFPGRYCCPGSGWLWSAAYAGWRRPAAVC